MNQENRYEPPRSEVADVKSEGDTELASRGARLGGSILDGLFVSAIIVPIMFATGYFQKAVSGVTPLFGAQLVYLLVGFGVYLLLHGYLLHTYGQSIGKRLAGTRIVSVEDNRILPLWKVIVLRQLPVAAISLAPFAGQLVSIVDTLFIFRSDKRCIHDLIASTKVVSATASWRKREDPSAQ
jgi:uncharacterized RDD family membrane protein YckC